MVSGHTHKRGGGRRRIRQQPQFTQLQRKGELTDPISPNVGREGLHVVMLHFQEVKSTFTYLLWPLPPAPPQPHHTWNKNYKTATMVSIASQFRSQSRKKTVSMSHFLKVHI